MTLPRKVNLALAVLVVVLLVGLVVAWARGRGDQEPTASVPEQRIGAATSAARQAARDFLRVDYRRMDTFTGRVSDRATGAFAKQYAKALPTMKKVTKARKSVARPTILKVGLSTVKRTQATAFVAADTKVRSTATKGRWQQRPWRIKLDMVRKDGRWLVADVQFVG